MKPLYICTLILSFVCLSEQKTHAQSIPIPFIINSASGHAGINSQVYDFSVGEMALVQTFSTSSNIMTQGFLQPYIFGYVDNFEILVNNNVLTPNGDGKNDVFVLDGLEKYPLHKLSIFDRAGRLIYQTSNYQNDWDGRFQGRVLTEDTYYFILDPGVKTVNIKRGFISIIHDKK